MRFPFIDSYVTLLRHNKQYRYLWLSQVISQVIDSQLVILFSAL